ncbi:hypothetical protein Leryth_011250 [Lithospermum erythrorhizon]|nr:hypothetical protein Leryth_011250 [Lithospermum erythrorhizon]
MPDQVSPINFQSLLACYTVQGDYIIKKQRMLVDCHCPKEFICGALTLRFPFTKRSEPKCGLLLVDCISDSHPTIQIQPLGNWSILIQSDRITRIFPPLSGKKDCNIFNNITLPKNNSAISFYTSIPNVSMLKCNTSSHSSNALAGYKNFTRCEKEHGFNIYYNYSDGEILDHVGNDYPSSCSIIQWRVLNRRFDPQKDIPMLSLLDLGVAFNWTLYGSCKDCYLSKQGCRVDIENYSCTKEEGRKLLNILLLVLAGVVVLVLLIGLVMFIMWRKKRINRDSCLLSSDPSSSKADDESGVYFGASVYSFADLEKATDNFASSRELGEGGFGIVYHGKLQDGRDVAVKRLYEHNYKRMEHFINEIRILTNLRHPNLVSLYGCTSKLSRELLLVYEYVPNGTLADHIHGETDNTLPLTWPIRMNIALQTANALAYLHKSDIIHRDVKTNNILLDHSFNVKVADFGLSRLFPTNVTHVSTAPQGTPGYVDPEYHECYQLTDKSDVYSFGVVLIELISSLPAVDVNRKRHEINLANLAMRKIQTKAVHELIDPTLEYESNPEVRRMMNSTVELAFCCLQLEKQMRPGMDEIVASLENIKNLNFETSRNGEIDDEFVFEKASKTHPSPESDEAVLIKHMKIASSPISVAGPWISESSTSSWSRETF